MQVLFSACFEGPAGYLLAVAAVAAVFLVRLVLQAALETGAVFILFIPVILISAVAGGAGPNS